jgi:hypothetical protein
MRISLSIIIVLSSGNNKGKEIVVITAMHKDNSVFPHIKRVNATDAIPAGAAASTNTHNATSFDINLVR